MTDTYDFSLNGLEVTQYSVAEYESDATQTEVTYTDDQGFTYTRSVNIPRNADGEVDEEYFQEILNGQLLGVNHKRSVGVAVFKDPNIVEDDLAANANAETPPED